MPESPPACPVRERFPALALTVLLAMTVLPGHGQSPGPGWSVRVERYTGEPTVSRLVEGETSRPLGFYTGHVGLVDEEGPIVWHPLPQPARARLIGQGGDLVYYEVASDGPTFWAFDYRALLAGRSAQALRPVHLLLHAAGLLPEVPPFESVSVADEPGVVVRYRLPGTRAPLRQHLYLTRDGIPRDIGVDAAALIDPLPDGVAPGWARWPLADPQHTPPGGEHLPAIDLGTLRGNLYLKHARDGRSRWFDVRYAIRDGRLRVARAEPSWSAHLYRSHGEPLRGYRALPGPHTSAHLERHRPQLFGYGGAVGIAWQPLPADQAPAVRLIGTLGETSLWHYRYAGDDPRFAVHMVVGGVNPEARRVLLVEDHFAQNVRRFELLGAYDEVLLRLESGALGAAQPDWRHLVSFTDGLPADAGLEGAIRTALGALEQAGRRALPFERYWDPATLDLTLLAVDGGGTASWQRLDLRLVEGQIRYFETVGVEPPITLPVALRATGEIRTGLARSSALARLLDGAEVRHGRRVEDAIREVNRLERRLAVLVDDLEAANHRLFERTAPAPRIALRAAIRRRPLGEALPSDLYVQPRVGSVTVEKLGGRESYHVCVDEPLVHGLRMRVTFRLPEGGSARVPYLGVRDAAGGEHVLFHLSSRDEREQVVIWRERDLVTALYRGGVATISARELGPELRLFFHLNDTSSVVFEELRAEQTRG